MGDVFERIKESVVMWDGLPQHYIRDTQRHDEWCQKCQRMVSTRWHEHHGLAKTEAKPVTQQDKEKK